MCARLIYRKAFRFLVDAKGWTEDGHGQPLVDVIAPDFGHLMEFEEQVIRGGVTSIPANNHLSLIILAASLFMAGLLWIKSKTTHA
jgi:hypothetical protein